jgi:integrase/recombinase XerD
MKKPKRIYEAVPEEDFVKLIKTTKKKVHRICFILAYGSGLRISEIKNLQPEDINLKEHKLFIRQAKGSKDRVVNSPKWLKQVHIEHFPIKISIRAIQLAFLNASKKAGFNSIIYTDEAGRPRYKYHFHSLRHSFATRALSKGVPVHYVQILLGHENLSTTNRYTKANPVDAIQDVVEKGI